MLALYSFRSDYPLHSICVETACVDGSTRASGDRSTSIEGLSIHSAALGTSKSLFSNAVRLCCAFRSNATSGDAHPVCAATRAVEVVSLPGAWRSSRSSQIDRASQIPRKEHIMLQSRGPVSFHPLFTTEDIGLRKTPSVEHAIKVFLYIGEAVASRWIEMPKGVLLLQTVPDNPKSGAIYLYDRERQIFFFLAFRDGRDDSLTVAEFEQLVTEYDLVSWAANPGLLTAAVTKPASA